MNGKLTDAQRIVLVDIAERRYVDIRQVSEPYRACAIDLAMMEPPLIGIDADQMYITESGRGVLLVAALSATEGKEQ